MGFMFVLVVLGATQARAPVGFAGLAIGLALALVHLIGIPVINTSVNPARSTGPALFVGGWGVAQLWVLWLAPLLCGALAGVLYRTVPQPDLSEPAVSGQPKPDSRLVAHT